MPSPAIVPDAIVALGLVQVPEGRRVFPELSVEDNLRAGAYLVAERAKVRDDAGGGLSSLSAARGAAHGSSPARCRAASSRCSPSVEP